MSDIKTLHELMADGSAGADLAQESDVRLKEDIAPVGQLPNGLGLYSFRYIGGEETYVGVMAQDVAEVDPEAVVKGEDGYLRVHYGRLGIDLMTLDQWQARKPS